MSDEATNLIDLIDQLVPPQAPPPVSMMPQTTGWLVLAAFVAVGVLVIAWRGWRYWQSTAYRRAALEAVEAAEGDLSDIARILRQTALVAYPRTEVASLSGAQWVAFLERTGKAVAFDAASAEALISAPYRPGSASHSAVAVALIETVKQWIKTHRSEARS